MTCILWPGEACNVVIETEIQRTYCTRCTGRLPLEHEEKYLKELAGQTDIMGRNCVLDNKTKT